MGGTGKLLSLISAPLPVLYHRCPYPPAAIVTLSSSVFSSYPIRRPCSVPARRHFSIACTSKQTVSSEPSFHSKTLTNPVHGPGSGSLVWAEWVQLVEFLTDKGYVDKAGSVVNELQENGDLSEDFLKVAQALILFANENPELIRSLPKNHMKVVVENSNPHLFRNGKSCTFRLKSFLIGSKANVAKTIDLVQYILSYVCVNNEANEIIDESIKYLLVHLVNRNWICAKCKNVNSTRTKKCLICNETGRKIILTGEEWECYQCNFFNHRRNNACLRCDFKKRPEFAKKPSVLEDILNNAPIKTNEITKTRKWEHLAYKRGYVPFTPLPADMFANKISNSTDLNAKSRPSNEEKLPDSMPVRKGENCFVVSKKKDKSMTSIQNERRISSKQANNNNNFVPFVPFPPDYFAKKRQKENSYSSQENSYSDETDAKSSEGSRVMEPDPLDMSEEAKAERWFKRAAQIKDISELENIPDEDFPEIMPMRKGVNRFVVSKRKTPLERRLAKNVYRINDSPRFRGELEENDELNLDGS